MAKKKIAIISDLLLASSGVATQTRFLVDGLIKTGKYEFRQLGAAIKHDRYDTIKVNDDLMIKPIDGFGNQEMIRQLLIQERPDALMLFTDPRFFNHIFTMHDEIQQICPIVYNKIWDDSGDHPPTFNRVIYEICDLINCINWPTYEYARHVAPDRSNYIPHGVPADIYKKLSDPERANWRQRLLGPNRQDHFVAMFVGRNARRKRPSDIMQAFSIFLDQIQLKHGHRKATLVMHCNPFDQEGANLIHVLEHLNLKDHVIFSNSIVDFVQMNGIYNAVDCVVNASLNEGFGLPILEAKMAEVPCISVMTGGLTRQIKDHETGYEFGVAMPPDLVTLVGNQGVPFIAEDFVLNSTITKAFMTLFEKTREERAEIGKRAREHAMKHYALDDVIKAWDATLTELFDRMKNTKRETWKMITL